MAVFVLDKKKKPLMPCSEKRARLLLERGKAVVHRQFPFTIRLKERVVGDVQPLRLKLDPGSKVTGIALVREDQNTQRVLHLAEMTHRGQFIRDSLKQRSAFRRRRRSVNLRYRAPRFDNRRKPEGWLPPSLQHRVGGVNSWVERYRRIVPLSAISVERVKFDMQAMENPEITGIEYQQGELAGYELKEYLLEKWGRKCVYCGAESVPLQIEHIQPKSRGGADRASNLTLSCVDCNQKKGNLDIQVFLA